jgi:hypothetical protein
MPPVTIKKPQESLSPTYVSARVEALQSKSPAVVLSAAGDLLRRSQRLLTAGAGREVMEQVERAIQQITIADATAAVVAIDVASCRSSVERAGGQAFDAAFADTPEERAKCAKAAVDALLARDAVESTLVASRRRMTNEAAPTAASLLSAVEEKTEAMRAVDALFGQSVGRELTGINEERRALLREIDAALHDECPWFTRFSGADDMLQVLGGTKTSDVSEGAAAALRASSLPAFARRSKGNSAPASRAGEGHVDAEASALSRVALGTASADERAFLERRAKRDDALAVALRELAAPIDSGEG